VRPVHDACDAGRYGTCCNFQRHETGNIALKAYHC
jgi:hypothetical protein